MLLHSLTAALLALGPIAQTPTPDPEPDPEPISVAQICAATGIEQVDALLENVTENQLIGALAPLLDLTTPQADSLELNAAVDLGNIRQALNCEEDLDPTPTTTPPTPTTPPPADDDDDPVDPGSLNFNACQITAAQFIDRLEMLSPADAQAKVDVLDRDITVLDANPDTPRVDIENGTVEPLIVRAFNDFKAAECDDEPSGSDDDNDDEDFPSVAPETGGE